ncbi:hypothetical protein HMPREF3190_01591 [Umbribacter vaginalis]|nr:hypothetical protein HMPREF3190_01591 [Coriobacteriales bacterium DNF00809]
MCTFRLVMCAFRLACAICTKQHTPCALHRSPPDSACHQRQRHLAP